MLSKSLWEKQCKECAEKTKLPDESQVKIGKLIGELNAADTAMKKLIELRELSSLLKKLDVSKYKGDKMHKHLVALKAEAEKIADGLEGVLKQRVDLLQSVAEAHDRAKLDWENMDKKKFESEMTLLGGLISHIANAAALGKEHDEQCEKVYDVVQKVKEGREEFEQDMMKKVYLRPERLMAEIDEIKKALKRVALTTPRKEGEKLEETPDRNQQVEEELEKRETELAAIGETKKTTADVGRFKLIRSLTTLRLAIEAI
jgi:hypothetical protein